MAGIVVCLGAVLVPATAGAARAGRPSSGREATATAGRATLRRAWAADTRGHRAAPTGSSAGTPTLTADPSTGLLDGQSISVSGSGLAAATLYGVIECQTGATDITGCDLSGFSGVPTDGTGSFSTPTTVIRTIEPEGTGTPIDCATTDACVLAVAPADGSVAAATPISFADVVIVPPTVSAVPATGLRDAQKITVSGTNFSPSAPVSIAECPTAGSTGNPEVDCDITTVAGVTADGTGAFSTPYRVTRVIESLNGSVDCAQQGACVLSAFNFNEPAQTANVAVSFADVAIKPPVLTASPSTELADGTNIAVKGRGFRPHDPIGLTECVSGSTDGSECVAEAGIGNSDEVMTNGSGHFSTTFNVARILTLFGGTVDCVDAPGCVIGAIDLNSLSGSVVAAAPLGFDPSVKPLPPLNLEVRIDPTGQIVPGGRRTNDAEISGTMRCDRTTPIPVEFQLQLTEPVGPVQAGGLLLGVASCTRRGVSFTESVSSGHGPSAQRFAPGPAGVLLGVFADSGSSSQSTTTNASVTLKVASSS